MRFRAGLRKRGSRENTATLLAVNLNLRQGRIVNYLQKTPEGVKAASLYHYELMFLLDQYSGYAVSFRCLI